MTAGAELGRGEDRTQEERNLAAHRGYLEDSSRPESYAIKY